MKKYAVIISNFYVEELYRRIYVNNYLPIGSIWIKQIGFSGDELIPINSELKYSKDFHKDLVKLFDTLEEAKEFSKTLINAFDNLKNIIGKDIKMVTITQ